MDNVHIFYPAKETTKRLKNQLHQGCMTEVMQRLDEKLRQFYPVAESHKRINQVK
jgi:hypothetical protein